MAAMTFENLPENKEHLEKLLSHKGKLIPFIGAGFSMPSCPGWGDFLESFYQSVRENFFMPDDEKKYEALKSSEKDNKFELIADMLCRNTGRLRFGDEIKKNFHIPVLPSDMKKKFRLLHDTFPGLKITTNYDNLIEDSAPVHVDVCHGNRPQDLERLFTHSDQNSLLKIHGGVGDITSIVLSTEQYQEMYGHVTGFNDDASLVKFLKRVFTNSSLLLTGCSVENDRTLMVLESLIHIREHFAVLRKPETREKKVLMNQRLSRYGIYPIWITDFSEIEDILKMLCPELPIEITPVIDHGATFVGREKELQDILKHLRSPSGTVQTISGRLFNLDGAGGVGKTTLALEAAKQCQAFFPDGVLPLIRTDEHTPMSLVKHLADFFKVKIDEPPDAKIAQHLITALLRDRHALIILDNVIQWENLPFMLPTQTNCALIITTRNRDIFDHVRLTFQNLRVHDIHLERFTPDEAIALFKKDARPQISL